MINKNLAELIERLCTKKTQMEGSVLHEGSVLNEILEIEGYKVMYSDWYSQVLISKEDLTIVENANGDLFIHIYESEEDYYNNMKVAESLMGEIA